MATTAAVPKSSKRQRTGGSSSSKVFLVIHDREPQDSGSDYHYSSFLHNRQDTDVLSVHRSYDGAARAAREYVLCNWGEFEDLPDADDEDGVNEYFDGYKWTGEGFYRDERCDANEPNDRVHIVEKTLFQ